MALTLPPELMLMVFDHADVETLHQARSASKKTRQLVDDNIHCRKKEANDILNSLRQKLFPLLKCRRPCGERRSSSVNPHSHPDLQPRVLLQAARDQVRSFNADVHYLRTRLSLCNTVLGPCDPISITPSQAESRQPASATISRTAHLGQDSLVRRPYSVGHAQCDATLCRVVMKAVDVRKDIQECLSLIGPQLQLEGQHDQLSVFSEIALDVAFLKVMIYAKTPVSLCYEVNGAREGW